MSKIDERAELVRVLPQRRPALLPLDITQSFIHDRMLELVPILANA